MSVKKSMSLLLIVMMLLLAGCGSQSADTPAASDNAGNTNTNQAEDNQSSVDPSADDSSADGQAGETQADEDDTFAEPLNLKAIAPEGATTIAMLKMIEEQPSLGDNVSIEYTSLNATDLLAGQIMNEEADFAIVPTNLAAKLYNKGVPYELASVNTHGNLYMITSDESLATWDDLKGKDVYMIGQGLVPDLIFRYLATANGLNPDTDMNLIYLAGATEIAPTFLSGKSAITIMPEPVLSVVSTKDVSYKVLFDFQKEYSEATGTTGGFPQAGLFVKQSLIEEHPDVVNAFVSELETSCDWVNANPDQAGQYSEDLGGTPAAIVKKAMPGLNIKHVSASDSKADLDTLFNLLLEASPESIGGSIPDEGFYFQ